MKEDPIEYTPFLDDATTARIHPAIDFKDKAYLGFWATAKEEDKDLFWLVSSNKNIILARSDTLRKEKIKLSHIPVAFDKQISSNALKEYIHSLKSVDPKELFEEILNTFKMYIEFSDDRIYDLMSLWVMGTYVFPLFQSYPYIYIGGIKECGKSKTLHVTSLMSFNSIFSGNMSTSTIFRLIQNARCSLFIDESEKLSNPERAQDFRTILLSGYKQGPKVYRSEKNKRDKFVVESFEVYSPKMLANILGLEDVLESRCIKIIMQRTLNKEIGDREPSDNDSHWVSIRDNLYIFALTNWETVKELYDTMPNEANLPNRDWESWHAILSLVAMVDKSLYEKMKQLAIEKTSEKLVENVTETGEYILVETLLQMVNLDGYYKVREIKDAMIEKLEEDQKWLTSRWVGRALTRLSFKEKRRVGTGYEYRLTPDSVKNIAMRLRITPTPSSQNTQTEG